MAKEIPSVGDMHKAAAITDDEIDAAVDAYLAGPKAGLFHFTSSHQVDVAAAVLAYPPAVAAVSNPGQTRMFKWTMVRTALLLAHPVKG